MRSFAVACLLFCVAPTDVLQTASATSLPRGEIMTEVHYRTVRVDGVEIFYREAGPAAAPTILLLHGFPTSSHMFRDLMPLLADRLHLIAPDYPGFGNSAAPGVDEFEYTFDHLAKVIEDFTDAIGLKNYLLYVQDFGGPVGFRLAARRPSNIQALIIQNANAYVEGMSAEVHDLLLRLATDHSTEMKAKAGTLFELPYTKRQYLEGVKDPTLVSPDSWQHAQAGMDRPGNKAIQYALHANYASNFDKYEEWHAYFQQYQPPTLVIWGEGDFVFGVPGAMAYKKDLKRIEVHILKGAGHFALETDSGQIAKLISRFQQSLATEPR
jgi:pimeloyl-ACP methyl ester carboxylesterase